MTDTEKRYVWYARPLGGFIIERYDLIRDTKARVVVNRGDCEVMMPKEGTGGRMFFVEAEARQWLRDVALGRAVQAKATADRFRGIAERECKIVDMTARYRIPTGPLILD